MLVALLAAWVAAHWPGLREGWWHYDDWALAEWRDLFVRGLQNGRPIEGLWLLAYRLEGPGLDPAWNIALRATQGLMHVAAAALAALAVAQRVGLALGVAAVLPFLLWPFGAEATLWRATASYPTAALAAITAVWLVDGPSAPSRTRSILSAACAAAAVLAQQSGACVGITLWFVLLLADAVRGRLPGVLRSGMPLLAGYALGGVLSWAILQAYPEYGRGALAVDPLAKVRFLLELERNFLASSLFYPRPLRVLHVLAVALVLGIVAWQLRARAARGRMAVAAGAIAAAAIAPYAAVLLVEPSWGPWRVMYAAPLLFTACFVASYVLAPARPIRCAAVLIHVAILAHYVPMAWRNAAEYPLVYRRDLELAERINGFARRHGADAVCVVSFPDARVSSWNPYGVRYLFGDSKVPALFRSWSAHAYLRRHVAVPLDATPPTVERCRALQHSRVCTGDFELVILPGTRSLGVLLP